MDTEKNLHASISPALLTKAENIAAAKHLSLDDVAQAALKGYIEDQEWSSLYAYGESQARKLGIREEDVDRIIHEFRDQERERLKNQSER